VSWETVFSLTNGWALLMWVVLAFAPRRPAVLSLVMYGGVAMLCAAYALMFGLLISGSVDAVGGGEGGSFTSLAGVMALFASKGGTTLGWTHYLAFDLFVGLWIARDADTKRVGRVWQIPVLFATLMAGPIGLLIWLIIREPRARAQARDRGGPR
jgi:hypothetical protein